VLQASTRQIKLQAGLYMIYVSIPNATGRCPPLDCPKLSILSPPPPPPLSSDICKCRHIQGRFSVVLGESGSRMPGVPVRQCASVPVRPPVCARADPRLQCYDIVVAVNAVSYSVTHMIDSR
jgi:hypothetical protein